MNFEKFSISIFLSIIILITLLNDFYHQNVVHGEALDSIAMTTVLARPLGGYGLTPLVFEPNPNWGMASSSSNSIETKVRKSPVYELLMPNFDDEPLSSPTSSSSSSAPSSSASSLYSMNELTPSTTKNIKKINFEDLLAKPSKSAIISPASSSSSNDFYNNVLNLFKDKTSTDFSSESVPSYRGMSYGGGNSNSGMKSSFGGSSYGGSSSSFPSFPSSGSYSSGGSKKSDYFSGGQQEHTSAIQSVRSVEVKEVQDSYENNEPQVINIPPSALPIIINFQTTSSDIQIQQTHEPSQPKEAQQTQSEDQPHFLKHRVTKPVIQEVHEIIMPYRKILQEVRPVEEEIKTIVARGSHKEQSGAGGYGGAFGGSGSGVGGFKQSKYESMGAYSAAASDQSTIETANNSTETK